MLNYLSLFDHNRAWASKMRQSDDAFFSKRADTQEPHFLFIGCCDSRVPVESLTGANPGEIFVHRNVANQADPTDMNMLSALEYAVEVLNVEHVLVCGHYQCGGVRAAMDPQENRLVDHWLQVVRDLQLTHATELGSIVDEGARFRRLVELNVLAQIFQLSRTPIVRHAWKKGRRPILHGLVYDVHDGLLNELVSGIDGEDKARELRTAMALPTVSVPVSLHSDRYIAAKIVG